MHKNLAEPCCPARFWFVSPSPALSLPLLQPRRGLRGTGGGKYDRDSRWPVTQLNVCCCNERFRNCFLL